MKPMPSDGTCLMLMWLLTRTRMGPSYFHTQRTVYFISDDRLDLKSSTNRKVNLNVYLSHCDSAGNRSSEKLRSLPALDENIFCSRCRDWTEKESSSSGSYSLWFPLSVNMMRQVWISQMERLPLKSMQLSCLPVPCLVCRTTGL